MDALIVIAILLLIFTPFYFLPTIIAIRKNHIEQTSILLVNIFLGFTGAGWIICLVWALSDSSVSRLSSLDKLKENDLLSNSEYEKKKEEILRKKIK